MLGQLLTRFRYALQSLIDATAWSSGLLVATYLRFEMEWSQVDPSAVATIAVAAVSIQVLVGSVIGLYVHRWRYGTFEEISAVTRCVAIVTPLVVGMNLLEPFGQRLPTGAVITAGFLALCAMFGSRMLWRVLRERWTQAGEIGREPVVVVGAGEGGTQAITAMLKSGPYHPVAIVDDNRELAKLRVKGVRVCGSIDQLEECARRHDARTIVIAIPSASQELLRRIADRAAEAGLATLILPPVEGLLGGESGVGDIRPLTEADLLGRRELNLDIDSVAGYLTGKRVLVTGAGGSIGSELCRQIHRYAPRSLVMLDRDESALQAVQISIEGRGLLDSRDLVVACIRDRERLGEVFDEHRPQVVFHAAALKHLPLLEMHPDEGWKTNVSGTQHLLELSGKYDVERFVNISTDKAADASSILGRTKRLAEQLTAHAGNTEDGTYLSVRFGNVLGSRGSVLPLFREQIRNGGPVTVTDPEVTRFFMTIPEACELVIQAGALDHDGAVLVLDMGEPVRIDDLAKRLIAESDRKVEIVYTGLRPGEKLHEVLFAPGEAAQPSGHPLITRVDVPALAPEQVALVDPATLVAVESDPPAEVIDLTCVAGNSKRSQATAGDRV